MTGRKRRTQMLHHIDLHLPPDLWREILARLPPKSLLRFRCVCKTWCCLIDDHDFISMHLNLYRNNSAKTQLLVTERAPKLVRDYIYTIRRSDNFRKIGQVISNPNNYDSPYYSGMIHGLKLMYCSSANWKELCLWNPSIRKYWKLPVCPVECDVFRCYLGFADFSRDYKVVAFNDFSVGLELGVAVYSLCDHRWGVKQVKILKPYFGKMRFGCAPIYFEGALYWRPPCSRRLCKEDTVLFSFDFNTEEFRYLKLPDVEAEMNWFLFGFRESLAFFCISEVRSCIWIMEKNAGNELFWRQCWDRETNVDVYKFLDRCRIKNYRFLYMEDTGMLLVQRSTKLIAYNITSNQSHYLGKSVSISHVETYVESLVLHKAYEGADWISVV